jgi:hypothetical protein
MHTFVFDMENYAGVLQSSSASVLVGRHSRVAFMRASMEYVKVRHTATTACGLNDDFILLHVPEMKGLQPHARGKPAGHYNVQHSTDEGSLDLSLLCRCSCMVDVDNTAHGCCG